MCFDMFRMLPLPVVCDSVEAVRDWLRDFGKMERPEPQAATEERGSHEGSGSKKTVGEKLVGSLWLPKAANS